MSNNLQAFFMQNAEQPEQIEREISKRFKGEDGKPVKFIFKAITPEKDAEIKNKSMIKKPITQGKRKGQFDVEFNSGKYQNLLTIESMVKPNLNDATLQESYGVMGSEALFNVFLLPAEATDAFNAAQEANGYENDMADLVDEVKN